MISFKEGPADGKDDNTLNLSIWITIHRILSLARPEWFYLAIASICATLIGISFPAVSIFFGEFFMVS